MNSEQLTVNNQVKTSRFINLHYLFERKLTFLRNNLKF